MFREIRQNTIPVLTEFSGIDRARYIFYIIALSLISILDLIGVLAMGMLALVSFESNALGDFARVPGYNFGKSHLGFEDTSVLVSTIVLVFVFKSIFGLWASQRLFKFLASRTTEISAILFKELLEPGKKNQTERTSQDTAVLLTFGSQAAVFDALGYSAIAISEVILISAIASMLVLLMPIVGIMVVLYFLAIAYFMNLLVSGKSHKLEIVNKSFNTRAIELIQSSLAMKQEISLFDKTLFFQKRYRDVFSAQSSAIGKLQVLGILPKYLLEVFLVIGALFVGGVSVISGNGDNLAAQMTLVLTSAFRIMPSFLRLQSSATQISRSFALSPQVVSILKSTKLNRQIPKFDLQDTIDSSQAIVVSNVSFGYPGSSHNIFNDLSFSVPERSVFAIVGESGIGKTTLLNLITGLIEPTSGTIQFSLQDSPRNPRIGFVPQFPHFLNTTIRENVALGIESDFIDDLEVLRALRAANILEEVSSLPNGIYEELGESLKRFSGGQKQRINIARALYPRPSILIFDEPTSALDENAKIHFSNLIGSLSKEISILIVTHDDYLVGRCDTILELK
jgi:ABC-type multidrug transport system fused ATPase/permease subunit